MQSRDIIVAPATALGGAIAVIRMSGEGSVALCDRIFKGRKPLSEAKSHTIHYGTICDGERVVDDVVVAVFRAPYSYTGEESVEISIHGSRYIAAEVFRLLCEQGAQMASAGEFSQRALAAGRIDLSQAEAVADLIAAESRAAHAVAATQMRGGYSALLDELREELLNITSLLELELDFSEEDVEFADRVKLRSMIEKTDNAVVRLMESFKVGNAIREGVTVAIVGRPNVGKSTLLNRLVGDDRAMVSDIAGTTRDTIEATRIIDGIRFRFIDTAGMHSTEDQLEQMGIERTRRAMSNAHIVLHVASAEHPQFEDVEIGEEQTYIRIVNKVDKVADTTTEGDNSLLYISAKEGLNIDLLIDKMRAVIPDTSDDVVVTNIRHYDALQQASTALDMSLNAMRMNMPTDLLSEDIRQVLHHLGEITGEITSDDILQSIFSKFCIGK